MCFWKPTIVTTAILFTSMFAFGGVEDKISALGLSTVNCKIAAQGVLNANGTWTNVGERKVISKVVIASNSKEAVQILLNKLVIFKKIQTDQEYFLAQDELGEVFAVADVSCN